MERFEWFILLVQILILGVQTYIFHRQSVILDRQTNLIKHSYNSQLLLELYKSFFENPLYSAITKAFDSKSIENVHLKDIAVYYNAQAKTYKVTSNSGSYIGALAKVGELEEFMDDYLGWFDVLGIFVKTGQIDSEEAGKLFKYYFELMFEQRPVREYLEGSLGSKEDFEYYWEGLSFLSTSWNVDVPLKGD